MWANTLFGSDLIPRGVLDDLGPEKIYCIDQLVTFRAHVHMGGGRRIMLITWCKINLDSRVCVCVRGGGGADQTHL